MVIRMSETQATPATDPDSSMSNLPIGEWLRNSTEDGPWYADEPCETKEQAVLAGIHDYGLILDDVVWVGKVALCPFPKGFVAPVHLNSIAESFYEKLGEEIGEASENFDWLGKDRAARKTGDPHAWRKCNEIEQEVCREIEKVIEAEMRKRGLWTDQMYFTLEELDGVTVTQELLDQSMAEYGD